MKMPYLAAALALALSPILAGEEPSLKDSVSGVASKVLPAFVFVTTAGSTASGAIISADGFLITNQHVMGDKNEALVRLGSGESYRAKLIGRDRQGDLALLKIDAPKPLPFLNLGDSDQLRVGDFCVAIGNPLALGAVDQTVTVTLGVVSGLHQFRGNGIYNDTIVTDAAINPGNSGGPLLNLSGELIGINSLGETRLGLRSNSGLAFAIPSNQVKLWIPLLKEAKGGDVYHARLLGLNFETDQEKLPEAGALIKMVDADSDAARAGFQNGDLIITFGDLPVWNVNRFFGILGIFPPGTELTAKVGRQGKTETISLKLDERRPARLGFKLSAPAAADQYVRLSDVDPASKAGKAGLRNGDEMLEIDKMPLTGAAQFTHGYLTQRWLPNLIAGMRIWLKVRRFEDGKFVEREVKYITD